MCMGKKKGRKGTTGRTGLKYDQGSSIMELLPEFVG